MCKVVHTPLQKNNKKYSSVMNLDIGLFVLVLLRPAFCSLVSLGVDGRGSL